MDSKTELQIITELRTKKIKTPKDKEGWTAWMDKYEELIRKYPDDKRVKEWTDKQEFCWKRIEQLDYEELPDYLKN